MVSTASDTGRPLQHLQVITGIQGLRFVAALIVVFIHLQVILQDLGLPAPKGGVDIFFVISGFIMVYTTFGQRTTPVRFALNRIVRIVPIYWIMTLATFALAFAAPSLFENTTANLPDLLKSLFFVPFSKDGVNVRPLLFVGWTLNYEMFFYAIFAVGLVFRRYVQGVVFSVGTLLACVAAGLVFRPDTLALDFFTDPILLEFGAGMMIGYFCAPMASVADPARRRLWGVVAIAALLLTAFMGELIPWAHRAISAGIPATVLVLATVLYEKAGGRLENRVALLLGDASYSLYLTHPFVTAATVVAFRWLQPDFWGVHLALMVACVVLASFVAVLCYLVLERPITNRLRGLSKVRSGRPLATGNGRPRLGIN